MARLAFALDDAYRRDHSAYIGRLRRAWRLLCGDEDAREEAVGGVREQLGPARARGDYKLLLRAERLLASLLAYEPSALLLPADPCQSRYAVVRPGPHGLEVFVLDRAVLVRQAVLTPGDDRETACPRLLDTGEPRTGPDDRPVVLRWLGAQQPPARLIYLPEAGAAAETVLLDALRSSAEP
jgi:hypothetical protein